MIVQYCRQITCCSRQVCLFRWIES